MTVYEAAFQTVAVTQDSPDPQPVCSCCGKPIPEGNLAWDIEEPDPLAYLSESERAANLVVQTRAIVQVKGLGNFIRVILPVPVEHDRQATFGVWLCITEPGEWGRVLDAGKQGGDAWAGLKFAGRLVTALEPWPDIFGVWTQAVVPAADKVPQLVHSVDPLLAHVLTNVWPEDVIRLDRGTHEPRDMEGGPTPNPYAG